MSTDRNVIRNMSDMLRQGATLTKLSCPACASPLIRPTNGTLWCVPCQKRVVVSKQETRETEIPLPSSFSTLEGTVLSKLQELEQRIRDEKDVDKLKQLGELLSLFVDILVKIRQRK